MTSLIFNAYFNILLSILLVAVVMFLAGIYSIVKKANHAEKLAADMTAIAGDDVLTTQLDLAKAFIETNKPKAARGILKKVAKRGSVAQKAEAKQLLSQC
ncbi:MAG: FimV/HubP family polar landmark protein [Gammaproteobacteria bacterium]